MKQIQINRLFKDDPKRSSEGNMGTYLSPFLYVLTFLSFPSPFLAVPHDSGAGFQDLGPMFALIFLTMTTTVLLVFLES